jgi:hypothetical protein
MGLQIHALGPDGEIQMDRHFSIWNYRRCIAVSGFTAGLLSKKELEHQFRSTADLQLFSNIQVDDDGKYKNPLDNPDLEIDLDITPPEDSETEFLYINTIRNDDLIPIACTVKVPKNWDAIPSDAMKPVLTSMIKQNMSTEDMLTEMIYKFCKKEGLSEITKKDARELALVGTETGGTVHEGESVALLGMILSKGMFDFVQDKTNKADKKALDNVFESWGEMGSLASFNGVWLQVAHSRSITLT